MAQLVDSNYINKLGQALAQLKYRCVEWDKQLTLTENRSFQFEIHLFNTSSLTLMGYFEQLQATFEHLQYCLKQQMQEIIVSYECERLVNQFSALLNIVNHLDSGNADVLYKRYSTEQEAVYQQLQKQYQYEKRLLTMIDEENTLYQQAANSQKEIHKARALALKGRYQKCNEYTQTLEFKMESLTNE